MKNQYEQVEDHILDLLESGGDGRLPSARALAAELHVSFPAVQSTLSSLERKGIVEIRPRLGAFVREGWRQRVLDHNLVFFRNDMLWKGELSDIVRGIIPEIRFCRQFSRGMFELQTTLTVQRNRHEYRDLSEFFPAAEGASFFEGPFRNFMFDGKIFGIPWVFSPRCIFCNRKLLRENGCPEPFPYWTWPDFLELVRRLRKHLPGEKIFGWSTRIYNWMNFVTRAGGALLTPDAGNDPVKIDSEATRRGLRAYRELGRILEIDRPDDISYVDRFREGELCFIMETRSLLHFLGREGPEEICVFPLPFFPGGRNYCMQATELLCVRRECTDDGLVRRFIKTMLSASVQDFIGKQRYGIPIRKESAFRTLNIEDSTDALFLSLLPRMTAEYNLDSPELYRLIDTGMRSVWSSGADLDEITAELAALVRSFIKFSRPSESEI